MVANTCNGAYARKAAILALIIPRRATKGLLVGQDSESNIDLTTYMHIKCVNDPRHTVHNDQGGTHRYKHDQSDSDSPLVNSASPSLSSSPLLGKLTRGSSSLTLRILRADPAMVQMDTTE